MEMNKTVVSTLAMELDLQRQKKQWTKNRTHLIDVVHNAYVVQNQSCIEWERIRSRWDKRIRRHDRSRQILRRLKDRSRWIVRVGSLRLNDRDRLISWERSFGWKRSFWWKRALQRIRARSRRNERVQRWRRLKRSLAMKRLFQYNTLVCVCLRWNNMLRWN